MAAEGIRFTDAQLYAFDAPYTQTWSERERWVKTQFAQYQAGKEIDRAQCIVLNDFSTPFDIHPKSKLDAAERYAAWALCETYGREILPGGPHSDLRSFQSKVARLHADVRSYR
jgi:hypothetical protein